MRLWSVHPHHLDRVGLVACWREALLAQTVLTGRTRGYTHHPQLSRFRDTADPVEAIGAFLSGLADEADARSYRFDRARIVLPRDDTGLITVTAGQVAFEADHLRQKLLVRAPERLPLPQPVQVHPVFTVVPGAVGPWEKAATAH